MGVRYKKITDHAHLVRDTYSNAVISTNNATSEAVMARRKKAAKQDEEISQLKNDIIEIKKLLETLINNKIP